MTDVRILHLSDVHFGVDAQLAQLEQIELFAPKLEPDAVVLSGDLTQRARHGEFQAAHALMRRMQQIAPTLVVPGNHDVQWWASPFEIRGTRPLFEKYRRWFGADLTPTLTIDGAVIAGALSAHGVSVGSLTWNLRDIAVKGHLPKRETDRLKGIFDRAPAGAAKVVVMHHNVLPGAISRRMGLADPEDAQRRLTATGADLVLCGHDHQEGAEQLDGRLTISTSSTQSSRTRGRRASVFNVVVIRGDSVEVQHFTWDATTCRFNPAETSTFPRVVAAPVVSVAGGDDPDARETPPDAPR
ncbi:MAG TPA: metallophosphoesterase [Gemmatimonadales bacterium]|nr:metallophosphoesterase [Gemmatimonadales bacterium]